MMDCKRQREIMGSSKTIVKVERTNMEMITNVQTVFAARKERQAAPWGGETEGGDRQAGPSLDYKYN